MLCLSLSKPNPTLPPQIIRRIRDRFGARCNLMDAPPAAEERQLQIMSTEDVRDARCDALECALHCADLILHSWREDDRREREAARGRVRLRLLLGKGLVGSVMGRRGSTIK